MAEWVSTTANETLPENAVLAGHDLDGSEIFIGRSLFQGEQLPCKVIPKKSAAYVSYDGFEHLVDNIEVLCGHGFRWESSSHGNVPVGAFNADLYTTSGEQLYIARASFCGSITPGKVHPSHGCLYIPFDGQEHKIESYEVLVSHSSCCCCSVQ